MPIDGISISIRLWILLSLMNISIAINAQTEYDIPLDTWNNWNWDCSSSYENGILTGVLTSGSGALSTGWASGADWSKYDKLCIVVEKYTGEFGKFGIWTINKDYSPELGFSTIDSQTTLTMDIDKSLTTAVNQLYIQGSNTNDTIKISRIYLVCNEQDQEDYESAGHDLSFDEFGNILAREFIGYSDNAKVEFISNIDGASEYVGWNYGTIESIDFQLTPFSLDVQREGENIHTFRLGDLRKTLTTGPDKYGRFGLFWHVWGFEQNGSVCTVTRKSAKIYERSDIIRPMKWEDPKTGLIFGYDSNKYTAGVTVSPNAKDDVIIPSEIVIDGEKYVVNEIGEWAFADCAELTSIIIPQSISAIGDFAFFGCSSLTSVTSEILTPFAINNSTFCEIGKEAVLHVPANCGDIYRSTEGWTSFEYIFEKTAGHKVELVVLDEAKQDLTNKVTITWFDKKGNKIATGNSITDIEDGTVLAYSVSLNEDLGRIYREVEKRSLVVAEETITCQLDAIEKVLLHGKVSAYGIVLPRVEVSVVQWLNGKYEFTDNTLTDANGEFSFNVYNDSTELAVYAKGYVDNVIVRSNLNNGGELGTIEMTEVSGKVIILNLSYQEATKGGFEPIIQKWYNDTRNMDYSVHNITKGLDIDDFAIQQGNLVLPTGADSGDKIQVSVRSLNDKFAEVTAEGVIGDDGTATISINLLGYGGIEATYGQKADDNLLAMLYDNTGKLQMRTVCSSTRLSLNNLVAGDYTLVTMGYNGAIGSIADLSDLANLGLVEGTDYVRSSATVRDGYISSININSVPELDASKFEYTGSNTSFLPNKTQLVTGNFITMTTRLDFKPQYEDKIGKAKVIVEIPEGCVFVPNSMVIETKSIPYKLNENRLIIDVEKENLNHRIRFCIRPEQSGKYLTTAYAEFDYKGTKTQPIGQVLFEATAGEFYVPSTAKTSTITVGGIGIPKAEVEVYDNESLIGTTRSLGNGKWSLKCELSNPYNLSTHNLYAKFRGEGNIIGTTETKDCFYDINAIVPKTVTMVNTAHVAGDLTPKVYETEFNYETVMSVQNYYLYWPDYPDFTFIIDLSENDPTKVSDVNLYVYTTDGDECKLSAQYDEKLNRFVATGSFDMYSLPVNVTLNFNSRFTPLLDASLIDESFGYGKELGKYLESSDETLDSLLDNYHAAIEAKDDALIKEIEKEICDRLNISWTEPITHGLSPSDDEVESFMNSCNNLIKDSSLNNLDILSQYESFIADNLLTYLDGYAITTCAGLNEEELIAVGYSVIEKTDGTKFYFLTNETQITYVDFSRDICITYKSEDNATKARAFGNSSFESRIQSFCNTIEKGAKMLNTLISAIGDIADSAIGTLNKSNEKLIEKMMEAANKRMDCLLNGDMSKATKYAEEYEKLSLSVNRNNKVINWLEREFKAGRVGGKFAKSFALYGIIDNVYTMGSELRDIINLYYAIPRPCEAQQSIADNLTNQVVQLGLAAGSYYTLRIASDVATLTGVESGLFAAIPTGGASLTAVGVSISLILGNIALDIVYNKVYNSQKASLNSKISALKCKNDDDDNDGNNKRKSTEPKTPKEDPSGYVYEAVPTNRIEGVKSTIYYNEDELPIQWNAEEYGEINPQITKDDGLYAWDVPQGNWKVVFEKEGYETTQTDWLPVPPPQLEINIPMSQAVAPYVEKAIGAESGITLTFGKYMKPKTLEKNSRILVTCNGESIKGDLELLNPEENPFNNEEYVSKIKFVPNKSFKTTDDVVITVKKEVESYAGKQMAEDFVQRVKIESEITEITCDSLMAVDYQGTGVLEMSVLPASAAKGKTVQVTSTSSMIATTDVQKVTLDSEGKARITVSGGLPGNASLHLSMPESGKEKYVAVNVVMKETEVKVPKASKLSGSTFEDSYLLTLTSATKGAIIYYTLDGSCPCDEQKRIKYSGPITLPIGQITLQAIATRDGMDDSEIVTYEYTVQKDATGIKVIESVPDYKISYQEGVITISDAKGASCHIYDLQGHELAVRNNLGKTAKLNVSKTNIYIVSLQFENDKTFVNKILAK